MKMNNLFATAILTLMVATLLQAQRHEGAQQSPQGWVSITYSEKIGRQDSRAGMEARLLSAARMQAVERVSGVDVKIVESNTTAEQMTRGNGGQWLQDYLYFTKQESAGRIVEEKAPEYKEINTDLGLELEISYRGKVAIESEAADPSFYGSLRSLQPSYRPNDTIRIEALSSQDAQLYLFNMMPDGSGRLIWPNRVESGNRLTGSKAVQLPGQPHRYAFVAELPEAYRQGQGAVQELIFGIFFNGNEQLFRAEDAFSKVYTFAEVNRVLLRVPRTMRTEAMYIYGIVEE